MAAKDTASSAHVGDWVDARGLPGNASRRGQIVELLGRAGHEHYRVRWDERHESILFPTDGVIVRPAARAARPLR
jgi:hypothetical protein